MCEFIEYETPTCNMKRLTQQDMSDPFKIIVNFSLNVNKSFEVVTTNNKARVISKKINDVLEIDPTIKNYTINIPFDYDENKIKNVLQSLLKSTEEKIKIEKKEEKTYIMMNILLGEIIEGEYLNMNSIEESISYLNTELHYHSIEFLSKNLKEIIEKGQFYKFHQDICFEVIDSYIRIQEEDNKSNKNNKDNNSKESKHNQENEEIFKLLKESEHIEIVMHFILKTKLFKSSYEIKQYVSDNLSDEIVEKELNQIIKQFREFLENTKLKECGEKGLTRIEFKGDELNGIISHLKSTIGENLISKNELKLSSGKSDSGGSLENIIKYDNDHINDYFCNNWSSGLKESEGWLEFDFVDRKIKLTSYTLRTSASSEDGSYHAKAWRIFGSNDRNRWDLINKQTNNSSLNGKHKQHRFECEQNDNYYRYIRYIQDESWQPDRKYNFCLTCVEFFGTIKQNK